MRIAVGLGAAAVDHQAGDLDPRHHHRGGGGGEGGGGGAQHHQQQQPQEPDDHRLLQLHHQEVQQEPSSVPVFQLQQLQAAAVRQRGLSEYALMGDAGHGGAGGGGFQPQLLSFGGGGGVGQHQLHQFTAQPTAAGGTSRSSREIVVASQQSRGGGARGGGGEIVAVQGGHIVRSTGRKDRHSKVCTARGPRDRRVRLSAHTAIQFYDVQDRLGYDRPSKAVDWLIKNAKDAIDKLDTLPPWHPTAAATNASTNPSSSTHPADDSADNSADDQAITVAHAGYDFPHHPSAGAGGTNTGGFLPSSLDSDSIADTIKSFFPMGGTAGGGDASSSDAAAQSSAMGAGGFQSYTPDLLSRTGSHHSQELRLSLQSSLSDPTMFHHHHHQDPDTRPHNGSPQQVLFPGYPFSGGMWAAADPHQRMLPWGNMPDPGGGGYLFNVSQQQQQQLGQQQLLFQRGPLQSSNSNQPSSDRGWPETTVDNPMFGFSGFRVPGRMQGDEDHNAGGGGNGDKPPPPSSVSSASHH